MAAEIKIVDSNNGRVYIDEHGRQYQIHVKDGQYYIAILSDLDPLHQHVQLLDVDADTRLSLAIAQSWARKLVNAREELPKKRIPRISSYGRNLSSDDIDDNTIQALQQIAVGSKGFLTPLPDHVCESYLRLLRDYVKSIEKDEKECVKRAYTLCQSIITNYDDRVKRVVTSRSAVRTDRQYQKQLAEEIRAVDKAIQTYIREELSRLVKYHKDSKHAAILKHLSHFTAEETESNA